MLGLGLSCLCLQVKARNPLLRPRLLPAVFLVIWPPLRVNAIGAVQFLGITIAPLLFSSQSENGLPGVKVDRRGYNNGTDEIGGVDAPQMPSVTLHGS